MSGEVMRYLRSQGAAIDPVRGSKIEGHLKSIKRSFRNGLRVDPVPLTGACCLDTLGNGFWMEDLWDEHFQGGKLMQTPGPNLAVEMPVHLEILEPSSDPSTNSVDERTEPLQTEGRSAGSIPAMAPGAEVRKRKANRAE